MDNLNDVKTLARQVVPRIKNVVTNNPVEKIYQLCSSSAPIVKEYKDSRKIIHGRALEASSEELRQA